jgi:hypothetical protein
VGISFLIYGVAIYAVLSHLKTSSESLLNSLKSKFIKRSDSLEGLIKLIEPSLKKNDKTIKELKDFLSKKENDLLKQVLVQNNISKKVAEIFSKVSKDKDLNADKNFKRLKSSFEKDTKEIESVINKYNSISSSINEASEEFPKNIIFRVLKITKIEKINL